MFKLQLMTEWSVVPVDGVDNYIAQFCLDYPSAGTMDVSRQPAGNISPSPNALALEVYCEESVKDTILADPVYADGVLWVEEMS